MLNNFRHHVRLSACLFAIVSGALVMAPVNAHDSADLPLLLIGETTLRSPPALAEQGDRDGMSASPVPVERQEPGSGATADWVAVAAGELDDMRGGFDTSLNLTLSFGIERAVYLNGALVTTTSFNLPSLSGLQRDEPGAILPSSAVAVLQNGAGNVFSPGPIGTPMAATVIQNTLNNQSIQSLTTINATANSLQLLRSNVFQSMVRDGINAGIVPH